VMLSFIHFCPMVPRVRPGYCAIRLSTVLLT
jgi:hypothetical protein